MLAQSPIKCCAAWVAPLLLALEQLLEGTAACGWMRAPRPLWLLGLGPVVLTGVSRSVSSLPSGLGTGGQGRSAASILKAIAMTGIWGKSKAPIETPPDGFEPATGCLEGLRSLT